MAREDRNRLVAQRDQIDLASADRRSHTARMLCQVYDGGAIPTVVPRVFLTHPAWSNVGDSEGATDSPHVDTATSIPVLVLGPRAPTAGSYLVAHAVGGRWVAQRGTGTEETLTCNPCAIPKKDLILSWPASTNVTAGSQAMVYSTSPYSIWDAHCFRYYDTGDSYLARVYLYCAIPVVSPDADVKVSFTLWNPTGCDTTAGGFCSTDLAFGICATIQSAICSPFHLHITTDSCCGVFQSRDWYIDE